MYHTKPTLMKEIENSCLYNPCVLLTSKGIFHKMSKDILHLEHNDVLLQCQLYKSILKFKLEGYKSIYIYIYIYIIIYYDVLK